MGRKVNTSDPLGLDSLLNAKLATINPDDPLGLLAEVKTKTQGNYPAFGSQQFLDNVNSSSASANAANVINAFNTGKSSIQDAVQKRDEANKSLTNSREAMDFVKEDFNTTNSSNTPQFPSVYPAVGQPQQGTGIPFVSQPGSPEFKENAAKQLLGSSEQLKDYLSKRTEDITGKIKDLTQKMNDAGDDAFAGEYATRNQAVYANQMADLAGYLKNLKTAQNILVAPMVAKEMIEKNNNQIPDPVDLGRQLVKYGNPNYDKQLQTLESAGSPIPAGRVYDMAQEGINAAKTYLTQNPTAPNRDVNLKVLDQKEKELQDSNNAFAVQTVNDKLGAYFLKAGNSGFWGRSKSDIQDAINDPASGLSDREKQIAKNYVVPNNGYDIPSSGFWVSAAKSIQKNAINTLNTVKDITGSRTDAEKVYENLNPELQTHFGVVGENPQGMTELQYLKSKPNLSAEEQTRKNQLENYVDVRGKWDKFKDGSGDFVGFATVMAIESEMLGGAGRLLSAGTIPVEAGVGNFLSRPAVGSFISSSAMMYDDFSKQALAIMPGKENEGKREAYSFFMTGIAGTAGHIIGAPKILGDFIKGVEPGVRNIVNDLTEGAINKAAAKTQLQELVLPFLKGTLKQSAETGGALSLINASQAIANSVLGGDDVDLKKTANDAVTSFFTGALYSAPLSLLAGANAVSGMRAWNKASVFDMSRNPGAYERAANDLHENGDITQEQLNEKIKIINTAAKINKELPKVYPDGVDGSKVEQAKKILDVAMDERGDPATKAVAQNKLDAFLTENGLSADELKDIHPKDLPEKTSYLLHRLNEELLNEKIDKTTDEVLKADLIKQRDRSRSIREGIYNGDIAVTNNYRDVAPDKKTADKLGLLPFTEVPQSELTGTKFENPKHEYNLPISDNPEKAHEVLNNDLKNLDESIAIAKENNIDTAPLDARRESIVSQIAEVEKKITETSSNASATLTNPLNSETNIDNLKVGTKILWDVYGNEGKTEWTVGEKTKTRGGQDAVKLSRFVKEGGLSKEGNIAGKTQEHIVPISELENYLSPNNNNDATQQRETVQNQSVQTQGDRPEHQGANGSQQPQSQESEAQSQADNSNSDFSSQEKVKPDPAIAFAGTPATPEEVANTAKVGDEVKQKFHEAPKAVGGPVTRTLPDGTKIKGRFIVTTADAVTPSHNPVTYETSKGFPTLPGGENPNDRDYKLPVNQGAVVAMGNDFGDEALNDVPVVDRNGVVLDGNNRTMSGQIAATQGTDKRYNEALSEQAYRFGVTPEQVAEVAKKGSPRVYFLPAGEMPYDTNTFARFNKGVQKEKSPMAKAIELGRTVPANVLTTLSNILDKHDTLPELYKNSKDVRQVFDTMVANKVLTEFEVPKYFNRETGTIENAGKDFLETLMLGNVVGEKELSVLNNEGVKSYRQKIVRALKPLAEIRSFRPEYQVQDFMNEAIRMKDEMVKKDMDLDTYLKSPKLFDAPPTVQGVTMLIALEENDKEGNRANPASFKNFITKYADESRNASTGAVSLFDGGAVGQDDILNLLIENYFKNEQQAQAIETARQSQAGAGVGAEPTSTGAEKQTPNVPAVSTGEPRQQQADTSPGSLRDEAVSELDAMSDKLPWFLQGASPDEQLKYIADQALNRTATGEMSSVGDARPNIENIFGPSLVEKAIQLYPLNTNDNGIQTQGNDGGIPQSQNNQASQERNNNAPTNGESQSSNGSQQDAQGQVLTPDASVPDARLKFERNPDKVAALDKDIDSLWDELGVVNEHAASYNASAPGYVAEANPEYGNKSLELVSKLIQKGLYRFEDIASLAELKNLQSLLPSLADAYKTVRDRYPLSVEIKNSLDNDTQIQRTADRYNTTGSPAADTAGVAQQPGQTIQGGRTDSAAGRGQGSIGRPPIRIADEENLPIPATEYATVGQYDIDEHQRLAVNLMANRFMDGDVTQGSKGFLLADGAGVGKTREIIAIADLMRKYYEGSDKGILLVAPSGPLKDSYVKDSQALKIPLSNFETGTYDDLRAGKIGKGKYGMVVFDESHNLKNVMSQRAAAAAKIESDHFVYASATPMDKPEHAVYFMAQITDRTPEQVQNELGVDIKYFTDRKGDVVALAHLRHGVDTYIERLIDLRNQAIKNGAMIRREYPFYGNVKNMELDMPAKLSAEIEEFTKIHQERIDNADKLVMARMAHEIATDGRLQGLNEFVADLKSYMRGKGAYALLEKDFKEQTGLYPVIMRRIDDFKKNERFQLLQNTDKANESYKVPEAMAYVKAELAKGNVPIVVGKYVNKHTIEAGTYSVKHGKSKYGYYKREVPAEDTLLRKLQKELEKEGIPSATIFGGNKSGLYEKERDKFQSGQAKVLLMTSDSGGTGINLDDIVGNKPRSMFVATGEYSGDKLEQLFGRVSRRNTASPSEIQIAYYRNNAADKNRREKSTAKLAVIRGITTGENDLDRERISADMQDTPALDKPFNPNPANPPKEKGIQYVELSQKAFMVQGDTFPVKDKIKALGAKWLQARKGWMFPTSRMEEVKTALDAAYLQAKGKDGNLVSETPTTYDTKISGQDLQYQAATINDNYPIQGSLFGEGSQESQAGKVGGLPGNEADVNTVRAVWTTDKNLQFTGTTRVQGHADVAHIMRLLETKGVEHAFAVHVDGNGDSHIQMMSIGGVDGTVIDARILLSGIDKFKTQKVYLVHNHPSGNLAASNADLDVTKRIREGVKGLNVEVEHVIMDGLKGQYTVLTDKTKGFVSDVYNREPNSQPDNELQVHSLNDVEILSKPIEDGLKLDGAAAVVRAIQALRFSALPKRGLLLVNNANEIIANYALPDITEANVLSFVGKTPTATGAVFFGNEDFHAMTDKVNGISPALQKLQIRVVDVVKANASPDVKAAYESAREEGMLHEVQEQYGTGDIVNDSGPGMSDSLRAFGDESADLIRNGDTTFDDVMHHVKDRLTPSERDALAAHINAKLSGATGAGAGATGGGAGVNPPGVPGFDGPPAGDNPEQVHREKMIELTQMEKMRKVYQDRRVALNKTQDEIIDKLKAAGAKLNDGQKAYDAYTLMKSKVAYNTNVVRSWFNRNPRESFVKRLHNEVKDKLPTTNEALAALSDYVVAVSSLERNEAVRELTTNRQQQKIGEITTRLSTELPKPEKANLVKYLDKLIKNQVEGFKIIPDGGSGMKNEMAHTIIADAGVKGLKDIFDKYHADFRENIIAPILENKLSYGLINQETADKLNKYQYYLPMKTDSTEFGSDFSYSTPVGSKVDADVYGIKGSVKERANPFFQGMVDLEYTFMQGELNQAHQALSNLLKLEPGLGETVDRIKTQGNKVIEPDVQFFDNGEKRYIYIKDDELKDAIVGSKRWRNNKELAQKHFYDNKVGSTYTKVFNFLAAVRTSYSPKFAIKNAFSDFGQSIINTAQVAPEYATQMQATASKWQGKITLQGMKRAFVAGPMMDFERHLQVNPEKRGEYQQIQQYLQRMSEAGGRLQWSSQFSKAQSIEEAIHEEIKKKPGALGWTKSLINNVNSYVKLISDVNENRVRLSVFIAAVEQKDKNGAPIFTDQDAARIAREISIDFEKEGDLTPYMRHVYMFSNARIQSVKRDWVTLLTKRGMKVAAGLFVMGYLMNEMNNLMSDCDSGHVDCADDISSFEKNQYFIMKNVFGRGFIKIPMPRMMGAFYASGSHLSDYLRQRIDGGDFVKRELNASNELQPTPFNVPGSGGVVRSTVPTMFQLPLELYINEDFAGNPIHPVPNPYKPPPPAPFIAMHNTPAPYKNFAQWLFKITGGYEASNPANSFVKNYVYPDNLEHLAKNFLGGVYSVGQDAVATTRAGFKNGPSGLVDPHSLPANRMFLLNTLFTEGNQWNDVTKFWDIKEQSSRDKFDDADMAKFEELANKLRRDGDLDPKTVDKAKAQVRKNQQKIGKNE